MSAVVVATAFGGPEVLSVIDEPTPEPGSGEVRIDVRAVGVNPVDYKSYSGASAPTRTVAARLGSEAAGVVGAVGPDVAGASVGDEVIAFRAPGAYAEQLVAPVEALTPKPDGVSWESAAGLMLTGVTAVHTLVAADVRAGDTVLVHGAAGGVGLMVVQLAVARRASVIGHRERVEARAAALARCASRSSTAPGWPSGSGRPRRPASMRPSTSSGTDEAVDVSLELVQQRSRIVSIAAFGRAEDGIRLLGGGPGAEPGEEIRAASRAMLAEAVGAGTLEVFVERTFPLAQAADAHRLLATGHVTGKLILTV